MLSYQEPPDTIANSYININGELVPGEEAHVSVLDRNFLYGDGVFDGMPIYEGKVILANRHIDRLYRSIRAVKIDMPLAKADLRERLVQTLTRSEVRHGAVRIIVSRGVGPAGVVNTDQVEGPTIVIIPQHTDETDVAYGRGEPSREKARIASTRTFPPDVIDPRIKSCNYLNNALAERELVGTDADFAIMLDTDGYVSEAFDSNIFIRDEYGRFRTPEATQVLGGITREVTMELIEEHGHELEVGKLTTYDLLTAEDLFMTSSGRGISSITELNGQTINDGQPSEPVNQLAEALYEYIRENEYIQLDV